MVTSAKTYPNLRVGAFLILGLHLGIRLVFPQAALFPDLVLFNAAAFGGAVVAIAAPAFNDWWAQSAIALAIGIWSVGSTISTANSFFAFDLWPPVIDICYSLYYPLMLFGIIRALTSRLKVKILEIFDSLIIALGLTSVVAGLLLKPAMLHFQGSAINVFLAILNPIGDIALLVICLTLVLLQRKSFRSLILLSGIVLFATTDLLFLVRSATTGYNFGSLTDDGWVLGLILIAESLFYHGGEFELSEKVTTVAATIAVFTSSVALLVTATSPRYLPKFILIPSFGTIALAFIRMQFAIRDALDTGEERELARTDELTGLPNRRRFLMELKLLARKEGALLLMDLDGFKVVNDSHGHEAGDQLLKQISIRFSRILPPNALLARLGGDEFGVIIFGTNNDSYEVAQALRSALSYPFALPHATVNVGVSIGRVVQKDAKYLPEDLLRHADHAMYVAKRNQLGLVDWEETNSEV